MWLLYDLLIHIYADAIRIAALFNPKAKAWVEGRKGLFKKLESAVSSQRSAVHGHRSTDLTSPPGLLSNMERRKRGLGGEGGEVAWFHCASLGEFEQGRPVIEAFRIAHPEWKILLTFFSPSGYEVRKNYEGADWVFYLPLDTPWNARKFINLVNPSLVVFVKYEFWFHYLDVLHRKNIPAFIISANFRPNHHFFKWYGGWARKQLRKVTRFFVQHADSAKLLKEHGIDRVTVSGDTRFDRVAAVAENAKPFPLVEKFAGGMPVFLAGSTWPADEDLILGLIKKYHGRMKFIIAPHEVGGQRVGSLQLAVGSLTPFTPRLPIPPLLEEMGPGGEVVTFTQLTLESVKGAQVLIVDGIGYLSHLYQYSTIAYIGGGFGAGIHNILEAAAFGKPVIFGPKYQKFREAADLITLGGAFSIETFEQLNNRTSELTENLDFYGKASAICKNYVTDHCGATGIILNGMNEALRNKS